MGIDVDANLAIGAVVNIHEIDVSEEILEEYDGDVQEYLYHVLEDDGVSATKSNEYSEEIILTLDDTIYSTEWDAKVISLEKLKIAKIEELKSILEKHNIKYKDIGVVLYPYYSH